jgi:anti-anti-sigma factor
MGAASEPMVIHLTGEYDISTSHTLAYALEPSYGAPNVVVDFSGVTYIDSTALSEMIRCRKRRAALAFPPKRFAGVNLQVRLILETTNLDKIWPIFDSVQEALASFN